MEGLDCGELMGVSMDAAVVAACVVGRHHGGIQVPSASGKGCSEYSNRGLSSGSCRPSDRGLLVQHNFPT